MEEQRDDDVTERIDEAFGRGDERNPMETSERDRPSIDEPQSQPDLEEEAKERVRKEPLGGNQPRGEGSLSVGNKTLRTCRGWDDHP
jgi:hypothetical protein